RLRPPGVRHALPTGAYSPRDSSGDGQRRRERTDRYRRPGHWCLVDWRALRTVGPDHGDR
ncbi:hypothetical protein IWQ56_006034, partial [Coemansia nantahalensis]